jgi:hypothetical protein
MYLEMMLNNINIIWKNECIFKNISALISFLCNLENGYAMFTISTQIDFKEHKVKKWLPKIVANSRGTFLHFWSEVMTIFLGCLHSMSKLYLSKISFKKQMFARVLNLYSMSKKKLHLTPAVVKYKNPETKWSLGIINYKRKIHVTFVINQLNCKCSSWSEQFWQKLLQFSEPSHVRYWKVRSTVHGPLHRLKQR